MFSNWKITVLVILIAASLANGWWRRRKRPPPPPPPPTTPRPKVPPRFTYCPPSWTERVENVPAVVTWRQPIARDDRPMSYEFSPEEGRPSGSTFWEGRHTATYIAEDSDGLTATCVVTFTVEVIRCPTIGTASRRSVSCTRGNRVNSRCTFRCSSNYYVNGDPFVTCERSGTWTSEFPICSIIRCPTIGAASHRSVSCTNSDIVHSRCTFICVTGYYVNGDSSVVCQESGAWTSGFPTCSTIRCPTIGTASHRSVSCTNNNLYQSRCTFHCETGYYLNGPSSVVCQTSRNWNIRSPSCLTIRCPTIGSASYRSVSCTDNNLYNSRCTFGCRIGYYVNGQSSVVCQTSRTWSATFPTCLAVSCPQLSVPSHGTLASCSRHYGSRCSFGCDIGYRLVGSISRECSHRVGESSGFWTGSQPSCQTVSCPPLSAPSHGTLASCSRNYGSRCSFGCNIGYRLVGSASRECSHTVGGSSGFWTGSQPTCQTVSCPPLSAPSHGTLASCSRNYGSRCSFGCDIGYRLAGSASRECSHRVGGSSGFWSGSQPTCQTVLCPPLSAPSHGTFAACSRNYGSRCSFSCDIGYRLVGSSSRECSHRVGLSSGFWTGSQPNCQTVSCPLLSAPSHGTLASCSRYYGSRCSFGCDIGYRLAGSTSRECSHRVGGSSGFWTGSTPTCQTILCPELSAPSHGTLASCSRNYGSRCSFSCDIGYRLTGSASRECSHRVGGSSGFWTGSQPTCQTVSCHQLSSPLHGTLTPCPRSYGSRCYFSCNIGYRLVGLSTRECSHRVGETFGFWTGNQPSCQILRCPLNNLPVPTNGNRERCTGSTVVFGDTCVLSCNHGYRPTTKTVRTCQDGGQGRGVWSGGTISCSMITCSSLSPPINGRISDCSRGGSSTSVDQRQVFGTICSIVCDRGCYLTEGSSSRTCQVSGEWDGDSTVCTAVKCDHLDIPLHSSIKRGKCSNRRKSILGTVCRFKCDQGYELTGGALKRTCRQRKSVPSEGYWDGTAPECAAVQCKIPSVPGGFVSDCIGDSAFFQESCRFACNVGLSTTTGESYQIRTCQAERTWTGQPFVCLDTEDPVFEGRCPLAIKRTADKYQLTWTGSFAPPSVSDNSGQVEVESSPVNDVSSESTYDEGNTPILFKATDTSGNFAYCTVNVIVTVIKCSSLKHPVGGSVQRCLRHYGSSCTVQCNAGYQISGDTVRRCELDESGKPYWTGEDTACTIRRCPVKEPPLNTLPSDCGGSLGNLAPFGRYCSYLCLQGFTPKGENTVQCQADGTWSETTFECEAIICPRLDLNVRLKSEPVECGNAFSLYQQQCTLSCDSKFSVNPLSSTIVTCVDDGTWSRNVGTVECKDNREPDFTSCSDMIVYTDPFTHTARIDWSHISATDNDDYSPTITCDPPGGTTLSPGYYHVTCDATDVAGNERICHSNIEVRDRTCSQLTPPTFGNFVNPCSQKEGSVCEVNCDEGYKLFGSSVASCKTVKGVTKWIRDHEPRCEVLKCNPLEIADSQLQIIPDACLSRKHTIVGCTCEVHCQNEFTLEGHIGKVTENIECLRSGLWDSNADGTYTCIDKVPPRITFCPERIVFMRTDTSQPAMITFDLPTAEDNSGENMQPILTPDVTSPSPFDGDATIQCLFQDLAGNQNDDCHIEIVVMDLVPPVILRDCPSDIAIIVRGEQATVTWEEPHFEDPGGKHVIIFRNYSPGGKFGVGNYEVTYTATNEITGRKSQCQFTIHVELQKCAPLERPANGQLECHETEDGQACVVNCLSQFKTPIGVPQTFTCDNSGKWQPPRSAECGSLNDPLAMIQPISVNYQVDDCSESDHAHEVAGAFLQAALQVNPLLNNFSGEDIKATCNQVTLDSSRSRVIRDTRSKNKKKNKKNKNKKNKNKKNRGRQESIIFIWNFEFELEVLVDDSYHGVNETAVNVANNTLQEYANDLGNILPQQIEFPDEIGGNAVATSNPLNVGSIQLRCAAGFVPDFDNTACVACVSGTFSNHDDGKCVPCQIGSYQDEQGQTTCKPCPNNTNTTVEGAKGLNECYELCPPGSFSMDGLFGCQKCEEGWYQPTAGQTTCISCPTGLTTPSMGATNVTQCFEPCPAGSYSASGLSPCTPCPIRYYQPNVGQRYCAICEGRLTTVSVGSTNQSQCIDFSHCSSNPCQNGARCHSLIQGFICRCAPGFFGINCEIDVDECESHPCQNGATCTDGVNSFSCTCTEGYTGRDCSFNIDDCQSNPCLNAGTCQDGLSSFVCHCSPGYEGTLCETERDPCRDSQCLHGGSCYAHGQEYRCVCTSGFTGKHCNHSIPVCSTQPCVNGNCIDEGSGNYSCSCFSGFTGRHCEDAIDFCESLNCENGGTCIQTRDGAFCVCPVDFTGDTCSRTLCDNVICQNGAECTIMEIAEQRNAYVCECLSGFIGRHCEVNVNECASLPCSDQDVCRDLVDGYTCETPKRNEFFSQYESSGEASGEASGDASGEGSGGPVTPFLEDTEDEASGKASGEGSGEPDIPFLEDTEDEASGEASGESSGEPDFPLFDTIEEEASGEASGEGSGGPDIPIPEDTENEASGEASGESSGEPGFPFGEDTEDEASGKASGEGSGEPDIPFLEDIEDEASGEALGEASGEPIIPLSEEIEQEASGETSGEPELPLLEDVEQEGSG